MSARGWIFMRTAAAALAAIVAVMSGAAAGCGKRRSTEETPAPAADVGVPPQASPSPPVRSESFRITDYNATVTGEPPPADAGAPASSNPTPAPAGER